MRIFFSVLDLPGFPTPAVFPLLQHPRLASLLDNPHPKVYCGVLHSKSVKPPYHNFLDADSASPLSPRQTFHSRMVIRASPFLASSCLDSIPKLQRKVPSKVTKRLWACEISHKLGLISLKLSATFKIVNCSLQLEMLSALDFCDIMFSGQPLPDLKQNKKLESRGAQAL